MAKSVAYRKIASLCRLQGFEDPKEVYKKGKLLFDDYRVASICQDQAPDVVKTQEEIEAERRQLRYDLLDMFWRPYDEYNAQMGPLVDKAMATVWFDDVMDYAMEMMLMMDKGALYKKILDKYFFHAEHESKTERMYDCGFTTPSVFYDRLEEAVMLFAIEAWIHLKNNEYRDIARGLVPNHPIFPDNLKK